MKNKKLNKGKFLSFLRNWRTQKPTMQWIVARTRPFIKPLMIILILAVTANLVSIAMTLINRNIIDTATAGGNFTNSIIVYILILIVSLSVSVVSGILSIVVNERFAFGIRSKIYESVLRSCWSRISKFHSGDIITRLSSDVEIVASGISEIIPSIFSLGVSLVAAFVTLAYFDIGIALFALILGPITALVGIISGRIIKPIQIKIQESESTYKSFMQESIENIVVYKAFEAETAATQKLTELRDERVRWVMKRQKISAVTSTSLSLAFQIGYISAFAYSAIQLSRNTITYGTMSVFLTLVSQIQSPIYGLSRLIPKVVSIFSSAGRIIEIDTLPAEDINTDALAGGALGLSVEDLSFSYGDENILEKTNVNISPGEYVALMGSSGIGKTTFIRLIMAYLDPVEGSVSLFDNDGKRTAITAGARKYISYVPQGNTLISGSILDNIRMGNPEIAEEDIWQLLKVVAVDNFVKSTPSGLDTIIGERGLGLSEGQSQRLSIARALAKRAPLLILDEATSALDEQTELAVLQHLHKHTEDVTCLIITHRRSVLKFCDRCIHIEDRKIICD